MRAGVATGVATGVAIEDIEALRRSVGVWDEALAAAVRGLRAGQVVNLTLLAPGVPGGAAGRGETLEVRVTWRREGAFRGRLLRAPVSAGLRFLGAGAAVSFTAAHIHSLARGAVSREC